MPTQKKPQAEAYTNENITYLEPRQHVRKRPGLYIGGTDKKALHHMVWEVLDDAISEFEKTPYNTITISLLPDKTICISDDGIGLPTEISSYGVSKIELFLTQIGIGGRDNPRGSEFFPTGGLHGIGLQTINALSSFCQVESKRDGFLWKQTYSEGLPTSPLLQIRSLEAGESTGTSISFKPDFSIMEENDFDFELIALRCQELAYLLPQLRFTVQDKRETEREISYHYPQGLVKWLEPFSETEAVMIKAMTISYDCELTDKRGNLYTIKVHVAFQWLWSEIQFIRSFVNTIETLEGGTHVVSLITALCKTLGIPRWRTLHDGFVGIIHILHPDPQFYSQTRIRLLNNDVSTAVEEAIETLFAAQPEAKAAIQAHFKRN